MATADPIFSSSLKVKLQSTVFLDDKVIFNVAPIVTESQGVNYQAVQATHMPGAIQIYTATNSRTFSIQPQLISRTPMEATQNLYIVNLIRSWTKPYFGVTSLQPQGTDSSTATLRSFHGAPPDVLFLSAYSNQKLRGNIYKIPVVVQNLQFTYPNDIDYIPTMDGNSIQPPPPAGGSTPNNNTIVPASASSNIYGSIKQGTPFPTVVQIDLTLVETHSTNEYSNVFDLAKYKQGILPNF